MDMELWCIVALSVLFFLTGVLDGISGGGGLISLPVLLLAGVAPESALGTNKVIAYAGMSIAFFNYARSGYVIWRCALTGIPAMALGAMAGAYCLLLLDSAAIGKLVVLLLPLGVLATFMPKKEKSARDLRPSDLALRLPLLGAGLGFYDGFFGPGSGTFTTLGLHAFLGLGLLQAVGSAKMIMLAGGISGTIVFAAAGHVVWMLALPCALSNMAGNYIGSNYAMRFGTGLVRRFLMFTLLLLFFSMVWKFWIEG